MADFVNISSHSYAITSMSSDSDASTFLSSDSDATTFVSDSEMFDDDFTPQLVVNEVDYVNPSDDIDNEFHDADDSDDFDTSMTDDEDYIDVYNNNDCSKISLVSCCLMYLKCVLNMTNNGIQMWINFLLVS